MTRQEIKDLLKRIQTIYPTFQVNDPQNTLDEWARFLGGVGVDTMNASLNLYVIEGHDFAPNVGQLLNMAMRVAQRNKEDMSAAEAWSLVQRAVENGIYGAEAEFAKLPERVKRCIGSAEQIRSMAIDAEYNEGVQKGIFLKQYEAQLKRERDVAALPSTMREFVLDIAGRVGIDEKIQ